MFIKKFLQIFIAFLFMLLCSATITEAADYYLGVYSNGDTAYLDTDSIQRHDIYTNGYPDGKEFSCNVKSVNPRSNNFTYIQYDIYYGQTITITKDGNRVFNTIRGPHDYFDTHPVESTLIKLINGFDDSH